MTDWSIREARRVYNIAHWSDGYFDINADGHVVARPRREGPELDLYRVAADIQRSGLTLPVLVRFTNILHDRVDRLAAAFARAMTVDGFEGGYTSVYPIKVNQQHSVVQEILAHGGDRVGLEAGSKPELMAVLGQANAAGGIIICNGYKDREYIRLALIGRRLGHRIFIVIEKPSELELVLEESANLGIEPLLGVRVRLASIGAGKWQNTGGEKSKFGLSAAQVLAAVERLRQAGSLGALQLMHFHLGSQLANIRDIQRGLRECARYYAELHRQGAAIRYVDVGGGLGVDYEGTRSRSFCSMNYALEEYANNVVHALWEICAEEGLAHPHIITESGRAMTAHHAVLITNVIDTEPAPVAATPAAPADDAPMILHDLWQALAHLSEGQGSRAAVEVYHDAVHWLGEAHSMYVHGVLTLAQRAQAEQLYHAICHRVRGLLSTGSRSHRELVDELNLKLTDKYFCNFSLFQSVPDIWAIEQIFPIMPLHRLDEAPSRRGVLNDLTCDSDGRIDHYVEGEGIEASLPLHPFRKSEPYLLGMFLVGAYQEILGDMHNLFGDTDSVHVELSGDGGFRLTQPRRGDTVESVLRYVQFEPEELLQSYRRKIAAADLSEAQRRDFLAELEAGLSGYTYLEE